MPDVYFNPGLQGFGTVGVIRSGQPTEYQAVPQGVGGGTSANNLIDQAIDRKQQLYRSYDNLADQLRYVNPRSREAASIHAQMRGIELGLRDQNWEQGFRMRNAENALHDSMRQSAMHEHTSQVEDSAAAMQRLLEANNLLRTGQITKDEHDQILLEIPQRYPNATHAQTYLNYLAERSDKMSDYNSRLNSREAGIISRKYGVPIEVDESGEPSLERTQASAIRSPRGQSEQLNVLNQDLSRRFGIHTGVASLFNPIEPHRGGEVDSAGNFKQSDKQTHIQLPFMDNKGQTKYATIPMRVFNAAKAEFQPEYEQIAGAVGSQPIHSSMPSTTAAPAQPQFVPGRQYRDAQGNVATFNQDGTWSPQ